MADNMNKPTDNEKTREEEIREWDESQSNSMLKPGASSNKRSGIAIMVAAVAIGGFVYWMKNGGDEPAATRDPDLTISEPTKVMDPTPPRKSAQVPSVSNEGAKGQTPRETVDREQQQQGGVSEAEKRRQQLELQKQLEHEKMLAARQRSSIFASAKDGSGSHGAPGADPAGQGGAGQLSLGGSSRGSNAPVNSNDAYASSTFSDGVAVSDARAMKDLQFKVLQGATIDAVLQPRAKSDLPGQVCVSVQRDVYAAEGRRVMIPWGSTVCGGYNASLKPGQERLFTIWNWLRTPALPGRPAMEIALNSGGTDQLGSAGQGGVVDNHWAQIFGVAAAVSIIGAGASNTGVSGGDQENSSSNYRTEVQEAAAESAQTILGRYANIQPSVTVPHGSRVVIYLNRDLDFSSQYKEEVERAQNGGVTYIQ
jgi:type IV secretion system protein VirB10